MGIVNTIKKLFGVTKELPLTETETRLLNQLLANRRVALEQVIPDDMRTEFIKSVYSDHHLKSIVQETYNEQRVSEDLRRTYLDLAICASISIKGFGIRLLLHHRIDPEVVAQIMLTDIELT